MLRRMSHHLTVRHATASHVGLVHGHNEDSCYAGVRLLAVADGVGGEVAGEVASGLVIDALRGLDGNRPGDAVAALRDAVHAGNDGLREAVRTDPALAGMATTLTALLLDDAGAALAHAGDSRAYRLRDGELSQLTRDDTYVQHLVEEGHVQPEDVHRHPQRSLVTRVLQGGTGPAGPADDGVRRVDTAPGDRYLLCSDGLPDAAAAADIEATLREAAEPDDCAARLIELALAGGGPDNVTVVVADLAGPAGPARQARRLPVLVALVAVALLALGTVGYLTVR